MCSVDSDFEGMSALKRRIKWENVVKAVEKKKLSDWTEFSSIRGDWGRAAVFYLARKYAGMTLKEIGEAAGGLKYPAVGQLVKRFERRLCADRALRDEIEQLERMLNV